MIRKDSKENEGIRLLLKKYRAMFEIPENLNHYSEADYKVAEKKFLKYAMLEGKARNLGDYRDNFPVNNLYWIKKNPRSK